VTPESLPVDVVGALRCKLGERALRSPGERPLCWVDIAGRARPRLDRATGALRSRHAQERIGCSPRRGPPGLLETPFAA
jgi:hypothetical protein